MDMDRLRQIIKLLKDEGLSEITVCEGEDRLTVRRAPARPSVGRSSGLREAEGETDETDQTFALTAPLVGTFYRRPTPDDDPFIGLGDGVRPGDTVCVIEAMKVMNEIKAEEPGRLSRILIDDGTPVEYGQVLFVFDRQ